MSKDSGTCGAITKGVISVLSECQKERKDVGLKEYSKNLILGIIKEFLDTKSMFH